MEESKIGWDSVNEILLAIKETAKGHYVPEEVKKERVSMCENCPNFVSVTRQCDVCLCFVDWKASLITMECPTKKWTAYDVKK